MLTLSTLLQHSRVAFIAGSLQTSEKADNSEEVSTEPAGSDAAYPEVSSHECSGTICVTRRTRFTASLARRPLPLDIRTHRKRGGDRFRNRSLESRAARRAASSTPLASGAWMATTRRRELRLGVIVLTRMRRANQRGGVQPCQRQHARYSHIVREEVSKCVASPDALL